MTIRRMMRAATRSAFLFAAVTACSEVVDSNKVGPENIPTVRLNPGQLEFAVNARNWTFDNTYVPDNFYSISNDPRPLDVGMAISEYSGGDGGMTITDGDNAVVFNQTLAGNIATGTHITVTGKAPFKIHIVANNYTGIIALGTTETGS